MSSNKIRLLSRPHARRIAAGVAALAGEAVALAERIAELAEPPMEEVQSSAELREFLARHGLRVSQPWRSMPTAFRAEAGQGGPPIALLAEYDALPECGPRPGQWGHGCGHNLLGTAAATAAVVAARVLEAIGRPARIVVFGCPAEEALGGKVFMAQQGAFAGLDAVLCWHPSSTTGANSAGGSAMDSLLFEFRGRTAHAAGAPHEGRSALDAAILMDVAANYLREHVEENVRIHGVVAEGGSAPNVVPDRATIWYFIRGRNRAQVDDLRRRLLLCARGAATATETRVGMSVRTAITERMPNAPLAELLDVVLHHVGPPAFTPADARAAAKAGPGRKYNTGIEPIRTAAGRASSDEDNVSWFAPLTTLMMACVPKGTVGHHREYAAAVRLGGARRGMLQAARVLAQMAVELALNAPARRQAAAEFARQLKGSTYRLSLSTKVLRPMYPGRAPMEAAR